jgi:hypothetical protein
MKTPDWYVFKDFLDCLPSEKEKDALCHFLHEDEQEDVATTPLLPAHPSLGLSSYQTRLEPIHYTWFIPFIERLETADQYLFIATLPHQQESLYRHFDLSRPVDSLTNLARLFLAQELYHDLIKDHPLILPEACLPEDPLNALLELSREELLTVVDFLSLHDLSLEMKTMINSSHLLKIESILSHPQKNYLYELKKKIEPIAFKPIGLNHWNGDELILKKILHQRGLNRLSKALSASHHSLLWHLSHKLDIERAGVGKTLLKS